MVDYESKCIFLDHANGAENNLATYRSEKAQVFKDKEGPRYLSFTGMLANTKDTVKRDFFVYDLKEKRFLLRRKNQNCCESGENAENVQLCNDITSAEHACFDPLNMEKFSGLVQHNKSLYAYTIDAVMESFYGAVWEIKDDKMQSIAHHPYYALNGCR